MSDVRNVWSKGEGLDGDFSTNMWTTADGIKYAEQFKNSSLAD